MFLAFVTGLPAIFLLLFVFNVLAAGVLALVSTWTKLDAWGQIRHTLPALASASGLLGLVLAALKGFLQAGQVEIQQTAPSDEEEFTDRFRKLVQIARRPKRKWFNWGTARWGLGYDRLVFFIDELDRCSESDVVDTLVAIRTFLDQEHCVFVVAADRRVLERALARELEQATPPDDESPYYSAASAFLDKIFAHQFDVPPLRGRRLSRFARELVSSQAGLWAQLRTSSTDSLDRVLYALIPAHVRSPRRIKVLLNRFATNVRLAESRGVSWSGRAAEIATLTALQAEFPQLAADLHLEPRLVRYLLEDSPPDGVRAANLWRKHYEKAPDVYLVQPADETGLAHHERELAEIAARHWKQLRRYLEATADVPGPSRSLLYLEAAGEVFDFEDAELGDFIEDTAPDFPDRVIRRLDGEPPAQRAGAVRLLADMANDLTGVERANSVHALVRLSRDLGDDAPEPAVTDAVRALSTYAEDQDLAPDDLFGVAEVALRGGDQAFAEHVLTDDRIWNDAERSASTIQFVDQFDEERRDRVLMPRLSLAIQDNAPVLEAVLAQATEGQAAIALASAEIRGAVAGALASDSEVAARIVDTAGARQHVATVGHLLAALEDVEHPSRSQILLSQPPELFALAPDPQLALRLLLKAWQTAPVEEWPEWQARTSAIPEDARDVSAVPVLATMLRTSPELVDSAGDGLETTLHLLARRAEFDDESASVVGPALDEALSSQGDWTADDDTSRRQQRLRELALRLEAPALRDAVEGAIAQDLMRGLEWGTAMARVRTTQGFQNQRVGLRRSLQAVETNAGALTGESLHGLISALPAFDPAGEPRNVASVIATRIRLVGLLGTTERAQQVGMLDAATVEPLIDRWDQRSREAVREWIELAPPVPEVRRVIARYGSHSPHDVVDRIGRWAADQTKQTRTAVLRELLLRPLDASSWIASVSAAGDADYPKLVRAAAKRLKDLSQAAERQTAAVNLGALAPTGPTAQAELLELIRWLSARDRPGADVDVAIALLPSWQRGSVGQRSLERELHAAIRRAGIRLSRRQASALQQAGIPVPEENLGKRLRRWLRVD